MTLDDRFEAMFDETVYGANKKVRDATKEDFDRATVLMKKEVALIAAAAEVLLQYLDRWDDEEFRKLNEEKAKAIAALMRASS